MTVPDPLLTGPEVAALLDIDPGTWRGYVHRGQAPKADEPGDESLSANRRTPRWRLSTIERWQAGRRTQAWRAGVTGPNGAH